MNRVDFLRCYPHTIFYHKDRCFGQSMQLFRLHTSIHIRVIRSCSALLHRLVIWLVRNSLQRPPQSQFEQLAKERFCSVLHPLNR